MSAAKRSSGGAADRTCAVPCTHASLCQKSHVMSDMRILNYRDFCYDFEPGERIGIVGALAATDSLRSLCTSSSQRIAGHQGSQHTTLLRFIGYVTTAGPNGAGKSTLLNLIAGSLPPVGGERSVGDTTVLGNFTQHPVDMPEHVSIVGWLR
jgi:ABC-type multidrug transport system fused ATPase/permease subunit